MTARQFFSRLDLPSEKIHDLQEKWSRACVAQQPTEQDFSRFTISWIRHNLTAYEAKLAEARQKDPMNFEYHYKQIRILATAKAIKIYTQLLCKN